VDTVDYLYGLQQGHEHIVEISKGVRLFVGLEAIGSPDAKGFRTVMATLNGQLRPINVRDRKIASDVVSAEKADSSNLGHVAAPFAGVVTLQMVEGARVEVGQPVATIEAMKMEATITANVAGVVRRLAISKTQAVDAGDLILVVEAEPAQ
jgi:pyruvate carboxylase